jgi:uncharacterized protein YcfJ
MRKLIPGLALSASLAFAGVAQAQNVTPTTPAAPSATGTPTTRPSMPMPPMPMMSAMADKPVANSSFTTGELLTIGAGVVVGAVLFQGVMWHGMTIMGAALGGWVGDHVYTSHVADRTGA